MKNSLFEKFDKYYKSLELDEDRTLTSKGVYSKSAVMLMKLYKLGAATKEDLLRFAGDPNYASPGQWQTGFQSFIDKGLAIRQKKIWLPGPNLQQWLIDNNLDNVDPDMIPEQNIKSCKLSYQERQVQPPTQVNTQQQQDPIQHKRSSGFVKKQRP